MSSVHAYPYVRLPLNTWKIRLAKNAPVHLLEGSQNMHITFILRALHWLPIADHVFFSLNMAFDFFFFAMLYF